MSFFLTYGKSWLTGERRSKCHFFKSMKTSIKKQIHFIQCTTKKYLLNDESISQCSVSIFLLLVEYGRKHTVRYFSSITIVTNNINAGTSCYRCRQRRNIFEPSDPTSLIVINIKFPSVTGIKAHSDGLTSFG